MNRILISVIALALASCTTGSMKKQSQLPEEKTTIETNAGGQGPQITVEVSRGESFYYPLFAIWIEDTDGNYIQTLYVARSVATGVFKYARQEGNRWVSEVKRAPQTLPYWAHKRGVRAADGLFVPDSETVVPDAYTGATPITGFVLNTRADGPLPGEFRVMLEINQNWDWNEYWTNDRFPGDGNYMMSCQPALVYEAVIDTSAPSREWLMRPIGHSHYSGKTGELFTDLSTITTALNIVASARVRIR
ncbi:MAG: DUF2271 domain-containing protein [Bacteroidales bacterium]|jgi:hypothetical protein|nr:DUF2271 domain-containing protein [Bacteroidales bacterium]